MPRIITIVAIAGFALAQPGCLVANTDCESDSDCKSGRVCQDGECVAAQGGEGGVGGGKGGSGGGSFGGSGGSQTFSTCYECADARCQSQRDNCTGADITFCYSLLKCMEDCSTASCSSACGDQWTGDQATLSLHSCVVLNCPICTNSGASGSGGGSSCGEPCSSSCCSPSGLSCCKPPFCSGDCAGSPCC